METPESSYIVIHCPLFLALIWMWICLVWVPENVLSVPPIQQDFFVHPYVGVVPSSQQTRRLSRRIKRLLRTNASPSDSEIRCIREHFGVLEERLRSLEAELSLDRGDVKALRRQRKATACVLDQLRTVSSPVRWLPVELLSMIFLECIEDDDGWSVSNREESDIKCATIWTLTHVCSHWRGVTVKYARLWSTVTLRLDKPLCNKSVKKHHDFELFRLARQLLFASTRVLSVHLYTASDASDHNLHLLPPLLATSSRWGSLVLSLPHSLYENLSPIRANLASLHTLVVISAGVEPPSVRNLFDSAMKLRSVRLISMVKFTMALSLQFNGVTRFEWVEKDDFSNSITHPRSKFDWDILRAMPNLVECSVDCREIHNPSYSGLWSPQLRRLTLTEQSPRSAAYVFKVLRAPVLEDLNVTIFYNATQDVREFLEQSQCRLKSLSLRMDSMNTIPIQSADLQLLFKSQPLLERVSIYNGGVCSGREIISTLVVKSGQALLPQLSSLDIRAPENLIDYSELINMLESRCRPYRNESNSHPRQASIVRLQRLSVERALVFRDPALKARWARLRAEGLRYSVNSLH